MEKKYEFIDRTLYLLRKEMEEKLPNETTLDEMIQKLNRILEKFMK